NASISAVSAVSFLPRALAIALFREPRRALAAPAITPPSSAQALIPSNLPLLMRTLAIAPPSFNHNRHERREIGRINLQSLISKLSACSKELENHQDHHRRRAEAGQHLHWRMITCANPSPTDQRCAGPQHCPQRR